MTNRIPLIVNPGAAQIQEIASTDTLQVPGTVTANVVQTDNYQYANGQPFAGGGNVDLLHVATDIVPVGNATQSLGNATNQWLDLYVSNATIYMNNVPIGLNAGNVLTVDGANVLTVSATGNIDINNIDSTANISIHTTEELISLSAAGNSWTFEDNGDLTFPNGTTTTGATVSTPTGDSFAVNTASFVSVSAPCYIAVGDEFVADTENNDDITVVQVGWTVDVGGTPYTVTSIDPAPPAHQYRITAAGATFVQGQTYTFTDPVPASHTWSIDQNGVLTAPGNGTISQINNDFFIAVSGTDVIGLRTEGGDVIFDAQGNLNIPGQLVSTTSVSRLSLNENGVGSAYLTSTDNDTTAVLLNTANIQAYAGVDVNITSGVLLPGLETNYIDSQIILEDLFTQNSAESGYPWGITLPVSYLTYSELILLAPGTFPNQAACTVQANSVNNNYELWQSTIADSNVNITAAENQWVFGSDGNLTIPGSMLAQNISSPLPIISGFAFIGDGSGLTNVSASTGNVTFDNITVQGVDGLQLSAGPSFTATDAYLRVRAGDQPSHIHLDTGDNSIYDLLVGDDSKYVQVGLGGNISIASYDNGNSLQYIWNFDTTGNLVLPSNSASINYANGAPYGGSGGPVSQLTYGPNSFALDEDGNVVFEGATPGDGVDRGLVWDYGAVANGVNSQVRQDNAGLTVRAWTENNGGVFSAPVNIVTNQDANVNTWIFSGEGDLLLAGNLVVPVDGGIRTATISPAFTSNITGITTGVGNVIVTIADEVFEGPFSGTVDISGVVGTVEADGVWGYQATDLDQFQLFTDATLTTPVDGTTWTAYVSGGIAVGVGSYENLSIQGGNIAISSNDNTWIFDTTGNLTIPNNIVSNTTIDIDNRASGNTADIRLYSADDIVLQARDRTFGSGSEGGDINIYAGDSAEDGDSSGGDVQIFAGDGGSANIDFGGSGGFITIRSGRGGSAIGDGESRAESGGSLTLEAGDSGGNNGNIDRGADGGDVFIAAGDSTGNLAVGGDIFVNAGSGGSNAAGGDIVLTAGTGGSTAAAGNVRITIPGSDLSDGGTWTFDGTGNLIIPPGGYINGTDEALVRIQSLDLGVVRSSMTLDPTGITRLESWDNQSSQGFTTADWTTGEYIDNGGGSGEIVFTDAPNIRSFFDTIFTSGRLFWQVNGGNLLPSIGWGGGGNNITFYTAIPPAISPETVTNFTIYYSNRSRMEMDYDEGELNITAQSLDIRINGNQDVDLQSSDRLRIENSSNVNGITISTDTVNAFRTWTFGVDGSLSLPSGANIANNSFNGGSASATVSLNAFSPDGNTVSIQAQGNTSSAVISIFSNAGPATSDWTFTTAPLDPSESFLYIPNGGAISTPDATGGEGGKNIFIQAGASDPVTWNSNPGGELMLKGGYGSFGDGGGGPGGDVYIEGGASSDSHAGNVNIASGLNTWTFDYTGTTTLPTVTNESAKFVGTRKVVGGLDAAAPYAVVLAAGGNATVAYTSSASIQSVKVTFVTQSNGAEYQWEQFDVVAVVSQNVPSAVNYVVSNRVKANANVPDTVVTATMNGTQIEISLTLDAVQTAGGWANHSSTEFGLMVD